MPSAQPNWPAIQRSARRDPKLTEYVIYLWLKRHLEPQPWNNISDFWSHFVANKVVPPELPIHASLLEIFACANSIRFNRSTQSYDHRLDTELHWDSALVDLGLTPSFSYHLDPQPFPEDIRSQLLGKTFARGLCVTYQDAKHLVTNLRTDKHLKLGEPIEAEHLERISEFSLIPAECIFLD